MPDECIGNTMIDLEKFVSSSLVADPFDHLVLQDFVKPGWQKSIEQDFPVIDKAGSFPLSTLSYGPNFAKLIAELEGDTFRKCVEQKFGLDLSGRPTMVTARGKTDESDGQIHRDSHTKIITMLIYFNSDWQYSGGRLRLLRSKSDIEDYVAEVEPRIGTLIAFRRGENSWHGHKTYVGPRRAIQLNWVLNEGIKTREQRRHKISAFFKKLLGKYTG